jgi:signal transduction histidine kinase
VTVRRRLLVSTGVIALVAVLVLGLPLGVVGARLLREAENQRLEREADQVTAQLAAMRARGEAIDAGTLSRIARPGHALEITLPHGRRLRGGGVADGDTVRVAAGTGGNTRVTVVAPKSEVGDDAGAVWLAVMVLSLVAVATAMALALFQARRLAGPLEALTADAARIGERESGVARDSGVAEIDRLASELRQADERIADLIRRERELSDNASHQLRTPLASLRMRLEEVDALAESPAAAHEAAAALAQADRLHAAIEHLESFARARDRDSGEHHDVSALVDAHVRFAWSAPYASADRELDLDLAVGLWTTTPPETVRQVVDVLLENALVHGAGAVTLRLRRDEGVIRIFVEDGGAGIADADVARIFQRGVSLASGSGLGLAVARELADAGGGELRLVRGRPPCFELSVPAPR